MSLLAMNFARMAIATTAIAILTPSPWTPPAALAHQTQINGSIGGTHHIEPNDTPRAGEPSQAWFALTQVGGLPIGLDDCDCELTVVAQRGWGSVVAQPSLRAIAVEGLVDVPAADVVFPQVGAYVLQLSGSPRGSAEFEPFRLEFPVTVAAGTVAAGTWLLEAVAAETARPRQG
ncbi:MAG: hypothetical protein HC824_21705 [Synechococcales cyanobacterium RM1_1_8]|nr:hypothetical protein [Synechococcales cyanobacterium RM1_1_8]